MTMSLLLINPYNEDDFRKVAASKNYEQRIQDIYGDHVRFSYSNFFERDLQLQNPRQRLLTPVFSLTILRYYELLMEKSPSCILDIGCGNNIFKKLYPQIHGIDSDIKYSSDADEIVNFDEVYVHANQEKFDAVMALNSLMYDNILSFTCSINNINRVLKPGGRASVHLQMQGFLNRTSNQDKKYYFGTETPNSWQIAEFFDRTIRELPVEFLVAENYLGISPIDMTGIVRLVWDKPE